MTKHAVENVAGEWRGSELTQPGAPAVKNGNVAHAEGRAVWRAASTQREKTEPPPVHMALTEGRFAERTGSWPGSAYGHEDNPGYGRNAPASSFHMRWDSAVATDSRRVGPQRVAAVARSLLVPVP